MPVGKYRSFFFRKEDALRSVMQLSFHTKRHKRAKSVERVADNMAASAVKVRCTWLGLLVLIFFFGWVKRENVSLLVVRQDKGKLLSNAVVFTI